MPQAGDSKRPSITLRRLSLASNHLQQNEAKTTSHEAVDDEVDARVDGEQQVAGNVDIEQSVERERHLVRRVLMKREPGAQDEVGQLADDEDYDDDDQGLRVLTLLATAAESVACAALLDSVGGAHRSDQALVEERERRKRDEKSNDEEETRLVDEYVQRVLAHRRPLHRRTSTVDDHLWWRGRHLEVRWWGDSRRRRVGGNVDDDDAFEEPRQVVESGDDPDGSDSTPYSRHGAVLGGV